jgi:hypothetical protein
VDAWWKGFERRVRESRMAGDDHAVVNLLAMAAAYSPDAARPLGVALPFDLATARIDERVWGMWLAEDPVRFVERDPDPFHALQSIFIDCGTRDEFGLRWGARMLAGLVSGGRARVVHEEYEDGHMGTAYRYDRSLAFLAGTLERGQG